MALQADTLGGGGGGHGVGLEKDFLKKKQKVEGFPGGPVVRNPPANPGDTGSIRDPERSHVPRGS